MKQFKTITVKVTSQTLYNLNMLAAVSGFDNIGRVIDKLTREKMIQMGDKKWTVNTNG